MFWLGQLMGLMALIILIISFQTNEKNRLLRLQIFSSIFFALQYLFLGAPIGCLINLTTIIRNILFSKSKNIACSVIIILIMVIISIIFYTDLVSILPSIAVILYTIALWQDSLKITRIVEVISCLLFIVYSISVYAIVGLIATIIELIFVLIAIYRFDIKKIRKIN